MELDDPEIVEVEMMPNDEIPIMSQHERILREGMKKFGSPSASKPDENGGC
jgi:hypothetical protein